MWCDDIGFIYLGYYLYVFWTLDIIALGGVFLSNYNHGYHGMANVVDFLWNDSFVRRSEECRGVCEEYFLWVVGVFGEFVSSKQKFILEYL